MACCGSKPSVLGTLLVKNGKLKRKNCGALFLEFFFPLLFVGLMAGLKRATDVVLVPDGWSLDNKNSCRFEIAPEAHNKSCHYPYARFVTDTITYAQVGGNVNGRWVGHETAKLFLATSSGNIREYDALMEFVDWVKYNGTAEGAVPDFDEHIFVLGNGTVQEIEAYVSAEAYGNPFSTAEPECAAAIVFDKMDFENAQFEYTLRLNSTDGRFEVPRMTGSATYNTQRDMWWSSGSRNVEYISSGFTTFQQMIDSFLIDKAGPDFTKVQSLTANDTIKTEEFQPYGVKFVPFPVTEYSWDEFFYYVAEVFPLIFTLSYLYPVAKILENMVREKETRTTEMLKMMGVSEWKIILSWYITYIVFFFVLAWIITFLSVLLLPKTSAAGGGISMFVFFAFFLYGIAVIAFCFTLSTMFWKARTAFFVGVVFYMIGYFFYYSVNGVEVDPKPPLFLLLPQVTFSLMMQTVSLMEGSGIGAGLATLFEPIRGFTLAQGFFYLIFDTFFWTVLGLYLSAVVPREFGQTLPFYFFVTPSYWKSVFKPCSGDTASQVAVVTDLEDDDMVNVEPVEASLRQQVAAGRGVQIRNIRKTFKTPSGPKTAVDNFSLDMYEGQVLVLLGHNGAGKTTLLSILSGMLSPTEGDAHVLGQSISKNLDSIRSNLGFCPQHDVLYPELSVGDHLEMVGSIKGIGGEELRAAVKEAIAQVGLTEKVDVPSKALSGGMKRKLSLAMALIGDSKVVFCDEPSSGVDPYSRRSLWQIIQNNREGRVIVLTTHFMDEADVLGDRIAIMAEGELKCCGSSLYLKNKYGSGYIMTMEKDMLKCDIDALSDKVKSYVPEAKLVSNVGTEVSFQLPKESSKKFSGLFKELDNSLDKYGIKEYGISVTTLEEVFLNVASADDQITDEKGGYDAAASPSDVDVEMVPLASKVGKTLDDDDEEVNTRLTGFALMLVQFTALFRKRAQYSRRDGRSFVLSIVMPVVLYTVGLLILKFIPIGEDDPLTELSTDLWNPTFPKDENAFLPIMELAEDGSGFIDVVAQQENFDPMFELEKREFTIPSTSDSYQTLFNHPYVNGLATEAECRKTQCNNPSPLHGMSILEFSKDMILEPKPRNGASLYAAAVLQKMPAKSPHGCYRTEFEVNIDQGSIVLNYVNEACSSPDSQCLFLEAALNGFARECIPAGCVSNINEDEVQGLLRAFGGEGKGELTPEEQAEFDELVENTRAMMCSGNLCNSGPTNLGGGSICRGPGECIEDGLVAYKVNKTDYSFYVDVDVTYCDGRDPNTIDTDGDSSFGGGGDPVPPGYYGNSTAGPRHCQVSGFMEAFAESFGSAFVDEFFTNTFNASGCLNGNDCEFAVFENNGTTMCVFDTCVSDRNATLDSIETAVPGFGDDLASAQRYPCANQSAVCDSLVDINSLGGLSMLAPDLVSQIFNSTNNFTLPAFFNDTNINRTEFFEDLLAGNITAIAEILLREQANGNLNLTEAAEQIFDQFNSTGSGGFNITELLENEQFQEVMVNSIANMGEIQNSVIRCQNPIDTCVMAQASIRGQMYCLPTGCTEEFTTQEYAYIPLIMEQSDFDGVPFFECNMTECNYGCRAGGNCDAPELSPVYYNESDSEFTPDETGTICPPKPIRTSYTALINSTTRDGAPMVSNAIHNALLRAKLTAQYPGYSVNASDMPRIVCNAQPLPLTAGLKTIISGIIAFVAAIFALIAFAFVPASVASYVVQERERAHNVKHQQMVSGAGIFPYWFSLFSFDMLMYCVPWLSAVALILIFDIRSYIDNGALPAVAFMLFCYGLAVIPFAYLTSNLFSVHTTALLMTLFINLITGLVLMIASYVMDSLDKPHINEINGDLKALYRIFPSYCVGDSLMNLATLKILSGLVGPGFDLPHPLDWDVMGANVTYLLAESIVFLFLVFLIEMRSFYPGATSGLSCHGTIKDADFEVDEDVQKEVDRVDSGKANDDLIRIEHLRKVYYKGLVGKRGAKVAVRDVTLGIPESETFVLLGLNGAGKTTTFSSLAGNVFPSSGTAFLGGYNIKTHPAEVRKMIGMCPQFDAQLGLLTTREHLQLFGRLKGLAGDKLEEEIQMLLRKLTLTPFENKMAKSLSGGNRRKLSVGMAIIGSPRIVFLDEPTTGVDPQSRRFLWDTIEKLRSGELSGRKTSIVLTTHVMEECEALGTRVAIMVGGRLRCLGSNQHLKARFGEGLMIELKLSVPSHEDVVEMKSKFPQLPDQIPEEQLLEIGEKLGSVDRIALIEGREDSAWCLFSQLDAQDWIDVNTFLHWWIVEDSYEKLYKFMKKEFKGAFLVERHETQLRFTIGDEKLSIVFDKLESNKEKLKLSEYGVSQTSLDHIFNGFAAQQEEEQGQVRGFIKKDE